MNRCNLLHQTTPHFDGNSAKISLEPRDTGYATAMEGALDPLHGNPRRKPQQIRAGLSDVLFSKVAWGIICLT
jgi:hypothetical protein